MKGRLKLGQRWVPGASLTILALGISGCARSPDFNVLGSYFPGWLICMLLGVVLTAGVHAVLSRLEVEGRIAALPVFYLCLALLSACVCWLIVFE